MNLRKALDEAISRLQTNQEDVIDRSLIKNVILDWHAKKGKAKRDVMILLGSILHFTEDEKDKAFIGDGPGTFDMVYGAVAAPLPPAKLNVDKIEGDNVRENGLTFFWPKREMRRVEAVDALLSLMQVSLWLSDSLVTANCGQFMPSLGLSIKPLDTTITRFGIGVCHGHQGWCKKMCPNI